MRYLVQCSRPGPSVRNISLQELHVGYLVAACDDGSTLRISGRSLYSPRSDLPLC